MDANHDLSHALGELALDLRWTWSHEADSLWERVDAEAWRRTQNPWTILEDISADRLQALSADRSFVSELERLTRARQDYLETPGWFASAHGAIALSGIAYFSMEFGLGEALPLYAGGLGILAGDFLKTASDLGLPVIGIGLLYREGYFRQIIDASGTQQEAYPFNDPGSMPIRPAKGPDGAWLHIRPICPGALSSCASGRRWSGASRSIFWTPTIRSTARLIGASRASSTRPGPKSACSRRSS